MTRRVAEKTHALLDEPPQAATSWKIAPCAAAMAPMLKWDSILACARRPQSPGFVSISEQPTHRGRERVRNRPPARAAR